MSDRAHALAVTGAHVLGSLVAALALSSGCAELKQNLRGQELSFRGAYDCAASSCEDAALARSRVGTTEGTTPVVSVKFIPRVTLAFTAETAFESLTATAKDCSGNAAELPPEAISKPGSHAIGAEDARESWMVEIEPRALKGLGLEYGDRGPCGRLDVHVVGTWVDGAKYSLDVALTRRK
jgi:hypothetical protein